MEGVAGVYECRLDDKGRISFPSELLRQITPETMREKFVVRMGVEAYLVLFLEGEWQKKTSEVELLDEYDEEVVEFKRYFYSSVKRLYLDSNNKLLFPKTFLDHAGIDKDIVILAMNNSMEIWSKPNFDAKMPPRREDERQYTSRMLKKRRDSDKI